MQIRSATAADATAVQRIYRPYVERSTISFELKVPSVEEVANRIERSLTRWCWLVAVDGEEVVGYAYGGQYRARAAYAHSVETSAYVDEAHHRSGIARALYETLFERLHALRFESAYAGITLPNDASVAFHRAFGFEHIGVFPRAGYKFDAWHDVGWLYRPVDRGRK